MRIDDARRRLLAPLALVLPLVTGACATATSDGAQGSAQAAVGGSDERARARAQLEELASAARGYAIANSRCPTSLEDLQHPPAGDAIDAASTTDPWGNPVALMRIAEDSPGSAFVSAGPDGELLTSDDLSARADCNDR